MGLEVDNPNQPSQFSPFMGGWSYVFHLEGTVAQQVSLFCQRRNISALPIEEHEPLPLQKRIAVICVLHIYCADTHAECTCAKCAQIAHMYTKYVLLAFVLYVYIL